MQIIIAEHSRSRGPRIGGNKLIINRKISHSGARPVHAMPDHPDRRSVAWRICVAGCLMFLAGCASAAAESHSHSVDRSHYVAPQSATAVVIDGSAEDPVWGKAEWRELKYRWLGPEYAPEDFQGRFKVAWDENKIYILAEIVDDILIDTYRDPLVQYWDDDCLEIFLDEDYSGGDHQYCTSGSR